MERINKKNTYTQYDTIDYKNDIYCDITIINGLLDNYHFYSIDKLSQLKLRLYYYPDIDTILQYHWSKHHEFLFNLKTNKEINLLSLDSLENFNDFDNLYYFGMSYDGLVKNRHGKILSSLIIVDDITNKIYSKIRTLKKSTAFKEKSNKLDYVKRCDVVKIPYYNRDSDKDTHSIRYEVLLPQDLFDKLLGDKTSIDDYFKKSITDMILAS